MGDTKQIDAVVFASDSPEAGWPPFVEWLERTCKVKLKDCVRVTYWPATHWAVIDMFAFDSEGNRAVDFGTSSPCTYTRTGRVHTAPPVHPDRSDAVSFDGWAVNFA